MSETSGKLTREERLAAKLRENLRRRKTQARERDAGTDAGIDAGPPSPESPGGDAGPDTLPK